MRSTHLLYCFVRRNKVDRGPDEPPYEILRNPHKQRSKSVPCNRLREHDGDQRMPNNDQANLNPNHAYIMKLKPDNVSPTTLDQPTTSSSIQYLASTGSTNRNGYANHNGAQAQAQPARRIFKSQNPPPENFLLVKRPFFPLHPVPTGTPRQPRQPESSVPVEAAANDKLANNEVRQTAQATRPQEEHRAKTVAAAEPVPEITERDKQIALQKFAEHANLNKNYKYWAVKEKFKRIRVDVNLPRLDLDAVKQLVSSGQIKPNPSVIQFLKKDKLRAIANKGKNKSSKKQTKQVNQHEVGKKNWSTELAQPALTIPKKKRVAHVPIPEENAGTGKTPANELKSRANQAPKKRSWEEASNQTGGVGTRSKTNKTRRLTLTLTEIETHLNTSLNRRASPDHNRIRQECEKVAQPRVRTKRRVKRISRNSRRKHKSKYTSNTATTKEHTLTTLNGSATMRPRTRIPRKEHQDKTATMRSVQTRQSYAIGKQLKHGSKNDEHQKRIGGKYQLNNFYRHSSPAQAQELASKVDKEEIKTCHISPNPNSCSGKEFRRGVSPDRSPKNSENNFDYGEHKKYRSKSVSSERRTSLHSTKPTTSHELSKSSTRSTSGTTQLTQFTAVDAGKRYAHDAIIATYVFPGMKPLPGNYKIPKIRREEVQDKILDNIDTSTTVVSTPDAISKTAGAVNVKLPELPKEQEKTTSVAESSMSTTSVSNTRIVNHNNQPTNANPLSSENKHQPPTSYEESQLPRNSAMERPTNKQQEQAINMHQMTNGQIPHELELECLGGVVEADRELGKHPEQSQQVLVDPEPVPAAGETKDLTNHTDCSNNAASVIVKENMSSMQDSLEISHQNDGLQESSVNIGQSESPHENSTDPIPGVSDEDTIAEAIAILLGIPPGAVARVAVCICDANGTNVEQVFRTADADPSNEFIAQNLITGRVRYVEENLCPHLHDLLNTTVTRFRNRVSESEEGHFAIVGVNSPHVSQEAERQESHAEHQIENETDEVFNVSSLMFIDPTPKKEAEETTSASIHGQKPPTSPARGKDVEESNKEVITEPELTTETQNGIAYPDSYGDKSAPSSVSSVQTEDLKSVESELHDDDSHDSSTSGVTSGIAEGKQHSGCADFLLRGVNSTHIDSDLEILSEYSYRQEEGDDEEEEEEYFDAELLDEGSPASETLQNGYGTGTTLAGIENVAHSVEWPEENSVKSVELIDLVSDSDDESEVSSMHYTMPSSISSSSTEDPPELMTEGTDDDHERDSACSETSVSMPVLAKEIPDHQGETVVDSVTDHDNMKSQNNLDVGSSCTTTLPACSRQTHEPSGSGMSGNRTNIVDVKDDERNEAKKILPPKIWRPFDPTPEPEETSYTESRIPFKKRKMVRLASLDSEGTTTDGTDGSSI